MSQRLRDAFARGKAEDRPLFIPYVTSGYPTPADTVPMLLALEAAGADVIEVGVPFSDPLADGATIQHANHIAVAGGVTLRDCFAFVASARKEGLQAPVVLMGYYNPILAVGETEAANEAAVSGVDGFIVVDLPPDEAGSFLAACRRADVSFIPLVAPTTADARIGLVTGSADAFVYIVSVTGTTGGSSVATGELPALVARVRGHTSLPLAVGFGITKREHVLAVGEVADAAVVGSAIIASIDAAPGAPAAETAAAFVRGLTGRSPSPGERVN